MFDNAEMVQMSSGEYLVLKAAKIYPDHYMCAPAERANACRVGKTSTCLQIASMLTELAHAPTRARLKQPQVLHAHGLRRAPRARLLGARQVGLRAQQHALVRARERAQARPEPGQRRERERGVRSGAEHERERGGERPAHAGGGRCGVSVVREFCLFRTVRSVPVPQPKLHDDRLACRRELSTRRYTGT